MQDSINEHGSNLLTSVPFYSTKSPSLLLLPLWMFVIPLCFSPSSSFLLSVRDSCWVASAVGTALDPTSALCSCLEMWVSLPTSWLCLPWSLPLSRPEQKRYVRPKHQISHFHCSFSGCSLTSQILFYAKRSRRVVLMSHVTVAPCFSVSNRRLWTDIFGWTTEFAIDYHLFIFSS